MKPHFRSLGGSEHSAEGSVSLGMDHQTDLAEGTSQLSGITLQ